MLPQAKDQKTLEKPGFLTGLVPDYLFRMIFHPSSAHVPHSSFTALLTLSGIIQEHSCPMIFTLSCPSVQKMVLPDICVACPLS
jgi:hypothetical protein